MISTPHGLPSGRRADTCWLVGSPAKTAQLTALSWFAWLRTSVQFGRSAVAFADHATTDSSGRTGPLARARLDQVDVRDAHQILRSNGESLK